MNKQIPNARLIALNCLLQWQSGYGFAETLIAKQCKLADISPADRHLIQALVFGVLRHKMWLDHIINKLRKGGTLDNEARCILQLGLCQTFLLGMADHAAVFETVNMAPQRLRGLINAVLRNALRREKEILAERSTLPLAIRYSTPAWLVSRWQTNFGQETTKALLAWNNATPRIYMRTNPLVPLETIPDNLIPLEQAPGWYRMEGTLPTGLLKTGALYVADPSTRYAIELLAPKPGEKILDACAAPGGKSLAIIAATMGQAKLTATDLHDYRLPTLIENLSNGGSDNVQTAQVDWSRTCPPPFTRSFDAVLLDVPCSNTGVIQRRVDVRWRITPEEIKRLTALQLAILENGAQAVKPGGRLVYSTCSIDPAEDGELVRRFISLHPEWTLKQEHLVMPHEEKSDGAYAALLICA